MCIHIFTYEYLNVSEQFLPHELLVILYIYIYMHYGLIFVCDMHHKFHQIIVNS